MTLVIQEYQFETDLKAEETEKDILNKVGEICRRTGSSILIEAPFDKAVAARTVAEEHGGKLNLFRNFF